MSGAATTDAVGEACFRDYPPRLGRSPASGSASRPPLQSATRRSSPSVCLSRSPPPRALRRAGRASRSPAPTRGRRDRHDRRPTGGRTSSSAIQPDHATSPALAAGFVLRRRRVTNTAGNDGHPREGIGLRFSGRSPAQQFYAFVTTLVRTGSRPASEAGSTASTADPAPADGGVPPESEVRPLLHAARPTPGVFPDAPCASNFAPWIEELAARGDHREAAAAATTARRTRCVATRWRCSC